MLTKLISLSYKNVLFLFHIQFFSTRKEQCQIFLNKNNFYFRQLRQKFFTGFYNDLCNAPYVKFSNLSIMQGHCIIHELGEENRKNLPFHGLGNCNYYNSKTMLLLKRPKIWDRKPQYTQTPSLHYNMYFVPEAMHTMISSLSPCDVLEAAQLYYFHFLIFAV